MKLSEYIRWFFNGTSPNAQRSRRIAKIVFLVVLFIGLFWIIPVDQVVKAVLSAEPRLLIIGFLFSFFSTCLTAVQQWVLVRKQRISLNVFQVLGINLAAKFYSQFSPWNIVGSGYKWYRLSKPDGKPAEALAALAFFRLMETFLNIALGLFFFLLSGQDSFQINVGWFVLFIIAITLTWFLITRYSVPVYNWFTARPWAVWEMPVWKRILPKLEKFLKAVSAYADFSALELFLAIAAGVISQMAGVTSNLFIANSIGIQLSFLDMGWIYAVVILISQMPFAFANGLGFREVSLVFLFGIFDIGGELALAFSFLLLIRGVLISLVGGAWEAVEAVRLKRPPDLNVMKDQIKDP
jgi:uncharacterized protein (TIRG00374 family)